VDATKAKLDDKRSELSGTNEQVVQLRTNIQELETKQKEASESVKKDMLHEAEATLTKARNDYAPTSHGAKQVNETIAAITKLVKSADSSKDFEQWKKTLADILQSTTNGLTNDARKRLDESFTHIQKQHETECNNLDAQRRKLEDQRGQLQLTTILIKNQI